MSNEIETGNTALSDDNSLSNDNSLSLDNSLSNDNVEDLQLQIKKLSRQILLQEKKIARAEMVVSTRDRVMEMLNSERLLQEKALIDAQEANELQLTILNTVVKATKIGLWNVGITENDLFHPDNSFTWSVEFRNMLGYSNEIDFPNVFDSWRDRLHPEDKEKAVDDVVKHISDSTGATPYDAEYRLMKKDGEYSYFRAYGEAIRDSEGHTIRFAGALMDITKSKNILLNTERLRQEAEAANKAKSNFLANMSHEMRTPMNAIIGMTSIGKKSNEIEQKNYALNKIGDASSHLLGVINDVLDMAKIEANKLELSPIEYSFERMLQKALTVINFRVEEKQQRLTVNVDQNVPGFLIGDEQRLAQIITNLLSNAIKFTPEGGSICFDASLISETDGSCELGIKVTDNGIGISPEQKERLFFAFEQAEAGTSRQYGGTGLGLPISKRIIELMGGGIWVESEPGKGTQFSFTVKVQRSGRNSCSIPASDINDSHVISAGEFNGKKLLIAEDIEINREIFIALLEDTGLEIDCAENGEEAFKMIETAPDKYDIIFMDIQMPLMNGHEASRRIRAFEANRQSQEQQKRIPIIALTANVFKSDIEDCIAAGMDDHLGKPLEIDRVIEIIRKYFN
ncbi:MAG: ATP-binding protein [Treponema sp.]|nr:ATP-binding protein [Treponema sp.]